MFKRTLRKPHLILVLAANDAHECAPLPARNDRLQLGLMHAYTRDHNNYQISVQFDFKIGKKDYGI